MTEKTKKPKRTGNLAMQVAKSLRAKYFQKHERVIFDIESHPKQRNFPIGEKVKLANAINADKVRAMNEGKPENEQEEQIIITEESYKFTLLKLEHHLKALEARKINFIAWFRELNFIDDIQNAHKKAVAHDDPMKIVHFYQGLTKEEKDFLARYRLDKPLPPREVEPKLGRLPNE